MAARDLVEQQRAEQLLRDAKLAAELARQYGPAWERMRSEILQILAVVEKARLAGETVDTRWLLRKGYLDRLEKLVTFQTRTFLDFTARKVQESSVQAALDGQRDAAELVAEAAPGDVPKPLLETSYAVNNLAAGKPLRHLLDSLPGQVGSQAAGALLEGVVLGLGPREIARDIRKVATIPLTRALLISRTETLRVYRQAAFDRYRQSSDILTGWVWLAKLDDRTCPVCIALHGTRHELSEEMATHPNCRCSMAPLTEPWTDPDLPDTRFAPQTGEAWFKNLSPDRQRAILGPGKFALYESGELTLADLVQPTEHVVWGKGVREKALRDLVPLREDVAVAAPAEARFPRPSDSLEIEDDVREALDAIGQVHGLPDDGTITGFRVGELADGVDYEGEFLRPGDRRGDPDNPVILVRPSTDSPATTFVHEFGHYADWELLGARVSAQDPPYRLGTSSIGDTERERLRNWREAVNGTSTVQELRAQADALEPGDAKAFLEDYVLTDEELWARSYTQWIALRSGNEKIAAGVAGKQWHWPDDDFGPVASALDEMFARYPARQEAP